MHIKDSCHVSANCWKNIKDSLYIQYSKGCFKTSQKSKQPKFGIWIQYQKSLRNELRHQDWSRGGKSCCLAHLPRWYPLCPLYFQPSFLLTDCLGKSAKDCLITWASLSSGEWTNEWKRSLCSTFKSRFFKKCQCIKIWAKLKLPKPKCSLSCL